MLEKLKVLDVFKLKSFFIYEGSYEFRSRFGGICSICLIAIFLTYVISGLKDILTQSQYSVSQYNVQIDDLNEFLINKGSFQLAFGVYSDDFDINQYLDIKLFSKCYEYDQQLKKVKECPGLNNEIELEICSSDHFSPDKDTQKSLAKILNLDKFKCIKKGQKVAILGNSLTELQKNIQMKIEMKDPNADISSVKQHTIKYQLLMENSLIDYNDENSQIKYFLDRSFSQQLQMNQEFTLKSNIRLTPIIYERRDSLFQGFINIGKNNEIPLFSEYAKSINQIQQTLSQLGQFIEYVISRKTDANSNKLNKEIMQVTIELSQQQKYIIQKYQTLINFLINLGGLWQPMYFVFFIFVYLYNQRSFQISICNKLYRFKKPNNSNIEDNTKQIKKNRKSILNSQQIQYNNFVQQLMNNFEQKYTIKGGFIPYFFSFFGIRTYDQKLYENAVKQLKKDLDIVNICNKLKEIDQIKKILFSEKKMFLLKYFQKPLIDVEEEIDQQKKKKQKMKLNKMRMSMKRIKKFNEQNKQFAQVLLKLYEDNLYSSATYNKDLSFVQNILDHQLFHQLQIEYEYDFISQLEQTKKEIKHIQSEKKIIDDFLKELEKERLIELEQNKKTNMKKIQKDVEKSLLFNKEKEEDVFQLESESSNSDNEQ